MTVRPSVLAKSIALGEFHHWLALAGTRVGLSSGILSFIRPPACPPWLHGHYPLRSYYGDSDSCPALSSTRTGLLDYRVCISRHSVSNHPMRPRLPAMLLVPGGLDLRFALQGCRRFFGLRTLLAVSSVAYPCLLALLHPIPIHFEWNSLALFSACIADPGFDPIGRLGVYLAITPATPTSAR